MSIIGKELLPNVYISNVELYDEAISFQTLVADNLESPEWSNNLITKQNLKMKVLCVAGGRQTDLKSGAVRIIDDITNGTVATTDANHEAIQTQTFLVDNFEKKEITNLTEQNQIVKDVQDGFDNHKLFKKKFTFSVPRGAQNLAIFAFLYADPVGMPRIRNLNVSRIIGPIASERILIGGALLSSITVFWKSGVQYTGPVHYHKGSGWMEGARHSNVPHSKLSRQQATNIKIKDYRTREFSLKKVANNKSWSNFSDMFVSFDHDTSQNCLFFVDMGDIFIQKTKYGNLLFNFDQREFDILVRNIKIRNFNVSRNKIKTYRRTTPTGTRKLDRSKVVESSVVLKASHDREGTFRTYHGEIINQLSLNVGRNILAYEYTDGH